MSITAVDSIGTEMMDDQVGNDCGYEVCGCGDEGLFSPRSREDE